MFPETLLKALPRLDLAGITWLASAALSDHLSAAFPRYANLTALFLHNREVAILTTKAGVLKYAETGWAALDSGLSTLWILHNQATAAFRVVSRDETTQQVR